MRLSFAHNKSPMVIGVIRQRTVRAAIADIKNCEMHGADLSFEKSEVEATVTTPVISIKNPSRGRIVIPSVGEMIRTDPDSLCNIELAEAVKI